VKSHIPEHGESNVVVEREKKVSTSIDTTPVSNVIYERDIGHRGGGTRGVILVAILFFKVLEEFTQR
jgi:hypothetical protein